MIWLIIIVCIAVIAVAIAAATFAAARRCDRNFFGKRLSGNPLVRYFEAKDFEGLTAEPVRFKSYKGVELRGFWYKKEGVEPRAVVVFAHGYGAGHLAYTTEIDFLAGCGYAVFAFKKGLRLNIILCRLSKLQLFWMANVSSEIQMRSKRFKTPMN